MNNIWQEEQNSTSDSTEARDEQPRWSKTLLGALQSRTDFRTASNALNHSYSLYDL
jgi:hypothetical protein